MKYLVGLSIAHPRKVLSIIAVITVVLGAFLISRFSIETNPSKSFSRDLDVIKFYNLTQKKFGMKDMVVIGIENDKGVFNVTTLRYIEEVLHRIDTLAIDKSFNSLLTGKKEKIRVPSEIDTDDTMSIINADDVTVDRSTNTIMVGNLTSRARKKAGMIEDNEPSMEKLPPDNGELERFIPFLQRELRNNNLYRGTILSDDEKACAILVPIERSIDIKNDILRKELYTMINADEMRKRFSGRDYYFPHAIMDRTLAGITVNDRFLDDRAARNREKFKSFSLGLFKKARKDFSEFYSALSSRPVDAAYVDMVFNTVESDRLYEIPEHMNSYADMIDELYAFVLKNIDPFSRDNLEYKLYSVKDGLDVGLLYDLLVDLVEKDRPEEIQTYIAGMPVAQALIERFVVGDMSIFLNVTVLVIIFVLFLSFRSVRGVLLPLSCVGIGTVWVMSFLLLTGMKISSGTIPLPTILIAVGSSYIIHYISRYYEIVRDSGNIPVDSAITQTTEKIWIAIILCGVTTITAFMSTIASAGVIDVKRLGVLTSLGILVTMILTFTFVPAILALLPLPKIKPDSRTEKALDRLIHNGGQFTYEHPKSVLAGVLLVTLLAGMGLIFLKTESSITYFFRDDNPLRVSSKFIDRKLTGTGQMAIVFKMRDRVDISSLEAQNELARRIDEYVRAYNGLAALNPDLRGGVLKGYFTDDFIEMKKNLTGKRDEIEKRIALMKDLLNEYYEVQADEDGAHQEQKTSGASADFDIMSLSDSSALASSSTVSPVDQGVTEIIGRIRDDLSPAQQAEVKRYIARMRIVKGGDSGKDFLRKFNTLADYFVTDITQPIFLKKIDELSEALKNLNRPKAYIDGHAVKPVGKVISITDSLKLIYKVFYHDDNDKFNKIPQVDVDNLADRSLTDRDVASVCISQFSGSSPDNFKSMATTDLKLIQYMVFTRSDTAQFLRGFNRAFHDLSRGYFPENDPYVEKIVISGLPAINMTMNVMLFKQQYLSILITICVVFLVCFSIFRSFAGGLMSIVPISLTVTINMGLMGWFDFPINYGTVIIASIAIGAGIDYTIHFVERFKYESIEMGRDFKTAYFNTLKSTGRSIVVSSVSVGAGFAVLMLSTFKMLSTSGLMVALAMILSASASLTVLPALFNWLKPSFLEKKSGFGAMKK
jgi:predicted RND superfamily exporter protein